MDTATLGVEAMARKAQEPDDEPMGPIIFENLDRFGFVDRTARTAELARLVQEKTGKPMTRQRVAQILNAVRVSPETVEALAAAIGVKPSELTRKTKGKGKGK